MPTSTVNGLNGVHTHRPLKPGIFAPVPTFFVPQTEDLDLNAFESHVLRIARAGVGLAIAGSMGEAVHLTHPERVILIKTARKALDNAHFTHVPIIAGTGAGSTRETVELCMEAARAGADCCLVIASGYFATVWGGNRSALKTFFKEVAERSPIPIILYNYPAASSGIDLDSDLIISLATECPNICGVKLTCGNIGKLTRIASIVSTSSFAATYPRKNFMARFLVLGGFTDFLLPSAFANGHGLITGLANIAPYAINKLFELAQDSTKDISFLPEAQGMQEIIARADCTIAKASIAGTKLLLEKLYGCGGVPRRPLPPLDDHAAEALWNHPDTAALIRLEREVSWKGL